MSAATLIGNDDPQMTGDSISKFLCAAHGQRRQCRQMRSALPSDYPLPDGAETDWFVPNRHRA